MKNIGLNLESILDFNQFADLIRNQKVFDINKEKQDVEEEDEKNKEDKNINLNKEDK